MSAAIGPSKSSFAVGSLRLTFVFHLYKRVFPCLFEMNLLPLMEPKSVYMHLLVSKHHAYSNAIAVMRWIVFKVLL